ncbi:DUF3995 domain-containing protein [Kineococcus sp. SYSU DK006]|uniref:DUF3995 domain-containing protein n=1 Tax=Kineococcus sp. SYSU DK006 TaxID=3383127 RepID=UPI003D7CCEEE
MTTPPGGRALQVAAAAGLLHATSSLYWAFGGTWLLQTVGAPADTLKAHGPLVAFLALALIAAVKALAAVLPLLVHEGRLPRLRRPVRAASWIGGSFLLLYGAVNTVSAALVLSGLLHVPGPVDRASMLGHLLLWDPLFALWGACLLLGLVRNRHRASAARASPH